MVDAVEVRSGESCRGTGIEGETWRSANLEGEGPMGLKVGWSLEDEEGAKVDIPSSLWVVV